MLVFGTADVESPVLSEAFKIELKQPTVFEPFFFIYLIQWIVEFCFFLLSLLSSPLIIVHIISGHTQQNVFDIFVIKNYL